MDRTDPTSSASGARLFGVPVPPVVPGQPDQDYPRLAAVAKAHLRTCVPPLTPADVFWLESMICAYSPPCIAMLPVGRPISNNDGQDLFARGIILEIFQESDLALSAGLLLPGDEPGPPLWNRLCAAFHEWFSEVLEVAIGANQRDDARHIKLGNVYLELGRHLLTRHDAKEGRLVDLVNRAAQRRGVTVGNIESTDVFAALEKTDGAFFRGRDGRTRLNTRAIVDVLRVRRSKTEVPTDPAELPERADSIEGASAAAEAAETALMVRRVRAECSARGPACQAAFEYRCKEGTRAELAARHGVTPDQIRHAERWVDLRLQKLRA